MSRRDTRSAPPRPLVISIHGIRTRGAWQKDLTRTLNEHGFDHDPFDFGFFRAVQLLVPWLRRRKILWFLERYTRAIDGLDRSPSIIAHSFGTYLVAKTLLKYEVVKFDKIIFCGSIVRRDYPWTQVIARKQANQILNEQGRKDIWSKLAGWGITDAGESGVIGFTESSSRIRQIAHPEYRHSDVFFQLNYEKNWIPFLESRAVTYIPIEPPKGRNLRPVLVLAAVATVSASAYSLWRYSNAASERPADVPPPAVSAAHVPVKTPPVSASLDRVGAASVRREKGVVILQSDYPCSIDLDGKGGNELVPGEDREVDLQPGSHAAKCVAIDESKMSASMIFDLASNETRPIKFQIAARAKEYFDQKKREEEEANLQKRLAEQIELQNNLDFVQEGEISIRDTRTGLEWLRRPNGVGVSYDEAKRWCDGLGKGWRLPTIAEFQAIVDPRSKEVRKVSPLFDKVQFDKVNNGLWAQDFYIMSLGFTTVRRVNPKTNKISSFSELDLNRCLQENRHRSYSHERSIYCDDGSYGPVQALCVRDSGDNLSTSGHP